MPSCAKARTSRTALGNAPFAAGWLFTPQPSAQRNAGFPRGIRVPDLATLDYSAICGVARVVDIVTKSRSKWFWRPDDGSTNYGWVLSDVTALKTPIPCKGALGLWEVAPEVFHEIQRQLPEAKTRPMNEAETRAEHIDPALKAAGWGVVEGSRVRREYLISPGRIEGHGRRGKPLWLTTFWNIVIPSWRS